MYYLLPLVAILVDTSLHLLSLVDNVEYINLYNNMLLYIYNYIGQYIGNQSLALPSIPDLIINATKEYWYLTSDL